MVHRLLYLILNKTQTERAGCCPWCCGMELKAIIRKSTREFELEVTERHRQQIRRFIALPLTAHAWVCLPNIAIVYIAQHRVGLAAILGQSTRRESLACEIRVALYATLFFPRESLARAAPQLYKYACATLIDGWAK